MPYHVVVLYNAPGLAADHPDRESEEGVLESVESVTAALSARGHRVSHLAVGNDPSDVPNRLQAYRPFDVVFNLFEGLGGTAFGEAAVTGWVEICGWPHTGSPAECLALVRDKARTKWLLAGAGLPTAPFYWIAPDGLIPEAALDAALARDPWIVKPAREDASLGIGPDSVVTNLDALRRQVESVRQRYGDVLVERYIAGREFNVGVVALPEPRALPLAEIVFTSERTTPWQIVTYDGKWKSDSGDCIGTTPRCPADVDPMLKAEIERVALAAFRVTGCRDYARVDLRVDADNQIFVLEINGNPDIGPTAGFARALRVAGFEYGEFINEVTSWAQRGQRSETRGQNSCADL
jgi:D-alanine-D-alanine ligase